MDRRLPSSITDTTVLPLIAAPMFLVSGPELVVACCAAGVIGSFPAPNARTSEQLDDWMGRITSELAGRREQHPDQRIAPWAANIVVHRTYSRLATDLELVVKHRAPLVITALGSPAAVVEAIHAYGGLVFADVSTIPFARKAVGAGVDGLILVCAGAGGHAGALNSFVFVDAVRRFWDGPIVLAGGITSGRAIRAAQTLGADLAYMGTPFIATHESMASDEYKQMLVASSVDDILFTNAFTGVSANMLVPSIHRAGLDPAQLKPRESLDFGDPQSKSKPWKDIWSAGQSVGSVTSVQSAADLVARLRSDYAAVEGERSGDPWSARVR